MPEPYRDPHVGWVCPSCKATYAPWVASCPRCPMDSTPDRIIAAPMTTTLNPFNVCNICGQPFSTPSVGCLLPEAHADRADG